MRRLLEAARPLLDPDFDEGPEEMGGRPKIGKYELLRELGRGGSGIVSLAYDPELERKVAIKLLRHPASSDETMARRFQQEAKLVARLDHPNIATVFEAHDDYLVMQYVEGETLANHTQEDVASLVRLMRDAAEAVHYAHAQGVVHRDLKPHNLMIGQGGDHVFVMDFGLAKQTQVETSLSLSGHIMGTPGYMPPEQAQGKTREVGPRSDVYSLGATLYEVLSGEPPFTGSDLYEVLRKVVEEEAPRLPLKGRIDRDLRTIVSKCLEKESSQRYASARELADDLSRWLAGDSITARPPTLGSRWARNVKRRKGAYLVGGGVGLGLVVGFLFLASWLSDQRDDLRGASRSLVLWQQLSASLAEAEISSRGGEIGRARVGFEKALESCRRSMAEGGEFATAYFFVGRVQRLLGRISEARDALDRAIGLDPTLGEAHFERGLLFVAEYGALLRRHREIYGEGGAVPSSPIHDYEQFERIYPYAMILREQAIRDLSAKVGQSSYFKPMAGVYGQAEIARLKGERTEAREGLTRVVEEDPFFVEAWVSLARMSLEEGDLEEAIRLGGLGIQRHRGYGPAYDVRGRALLLKAQADPWAAEFSELEVQSLSDADSVFEFGKKSADELVRRGARRLAFSKLEEADEDFRRALELEPDHALAHLRLGRVHLARAVRIRRAVERGDRRTGSEERVGVIDEALREFEKARETDPWLAEIFNRAGEAHGERSAVWFADGEIEAGLAEIDLGLSQVEQALRLHPGYGEARWGRGKLFAARARALVGVSRDEEARGDWERALENLEAAVQGLPSSWRVLLDRGNTRLDAGQTDRGREDLEQVLLMAPEGWEERSELEELLQGR